MKQPFRCFHCVTLNQAFLNLRFASALFRDKRALKTDITNIGVFYFYGALEDAEKNKK